MAVLGLFAACKSESKPVQASHQCLVQPGASVQLNGGETQIGSDRAYSEEAPRRAVALAPFEIDATEVTNAQFQIFVDATGYVTDAEKEQPGFGAPGAAVFKTPTATQPNWWQFVEGANWRHPEGPESSIAGKDNDPVVQVSLNDARAYAMWAERRLPSEAEWEYAAAANSESFYVWGDDLHPKGQVMANSWQGAFPLQNSEADGFRLRAPVGCFPPNDFGLYDMIGNVWEWTDTAFQDSASEPIHVIKGGSFLCAENYCRRYRASARQPQEAGLSTNHIGFRTVRSE